MVKWLIIQYLFSTIIFSDIPHQKSRVGGDGARRDGATAVRCRCGMWPDGIAGSKQSVGRASVLQAERKSMKVQYADGLFGINIRNLLPDVPFTRTDGAYPFK